MQESDSPNENQNEYPSVLREKKYEKEGLVYSGSIMFSNLDFYDYNIDRTTGRLSIKIVKYQTIYDSYYNCKAYQKIFFYYNTNIINFNFRIGKY